VTRRTAPLTEYAYPATAGPSACPESAAAVATTAGTLDHSLAQCPIQFHARDWQQMSAKSRAALHVVIHAAFDLMQAQNAAPGVGEVAEP